MIDNSQIEATSARYKEAVKSGDEKEIAFLAQVLAAECHALFIESAKRQNGGAS